MNSTNYACSLYLSPNSKETTRCVFTASDRGRYDNYRRKSNLQTVPWEPTRDGVTHTFGNKYQICPVKPEAVLKEDRTSYIVHSAGAPKSFTTEDDAVACAKSLSGFVIKRQDTVIEDFTESS